MSDLQQLLSEDTTLANEALKALFVKQDDSESVGFDPALSHDPAKVLIVGGGPSGILLALRLSRDQKFSQNEIVLLDAMPTLGGRTFFSSPHNLVGMTALERFQAHAKNVREGKNLSGFGFEVFYNESVNVLERHIHNLLSDEEISFLDGFTQKNLAGFEVAHSCYFVKKEFTSFGALISGSSEIFTKPEAELFAQLVKKASELEPDVEKSKKTFDESSFWKELPKNRKEVFSSILETFFGENFGKVSENVVLAHLAGLASSVHDSASSQFGRRSGIELGLEVVLRARGVKILTSCQLSRLVQAENGGFRALVADEVSPQRRDLFAEKVVLTVPLSRSFSFVPREWLTASQSKLLSKHRPQSLVAVEFSNFADVASDVWPTSAVAGTRLVFPVERAHALVTSQRSLIFYAALDFEESLHAPAVRETLGRLRRAAARVVKPEALKTFEKGIPATRTEKVAAERIVLLPAAHAFPFESIHHVELKEVKMAQKNLFCCGDNFSFGYPPWKNVVNSVHEVSGLLIK